jgi:sporulation protein YlmC with PRC-barrel domain
MSQTSQVVKANQDVIGKNVKNQPDEDLGKIKEIVLDKISGQTKYVVLESGSFLGLGGKLFAIPWNSIHYNKDKEAFILNVDKERLKNAPGFDKDHWPEMKAEYFTSIDSYWR